MHQRTYNLLQHPRKGEEELYLVNPPVGVLILTGKDTLDFIQRMSTNDVRQLGESEGITTIFTNEKGRIIDVVDLYNFRGSIYLVYSIGAKEKVSEIFRKYVIMEEVSSVDEPDYMCVVSCDSTPRSKSIAADTSGLVVMAAPRIYPDGSLYYLRKQQLQDLELMKKGNAIDNRVFNVLRLEKGVPLFGIDFDETVNPLESNMQDFISWTKGCYIGQEVIARLDTYGKIKRFLKGIVLDRLLPDNLIRSVQMRNTELILFSLEGREIGTITSIDNSVSLKKAIALARILSGQEKTSNRVKLIVGTEEFTGQIVDLPFRS